MPQTKKKVLRPRAKSTSKPAKSSSRRKGSGRKHSVLFFWRNFPSWAVLLGALLVVGAYLFGFYYFFVGPYSFRWKAIYGESVYPEGYAVRGIDISHYQVEVDWEKLRNASLNNDPVSFVIIKATEGETKFDEYFNDNFYKAHENDLIRGAYHYYVPSVSPEKQARFYLRQVHLQPGDIPPVLDVEDKGNLTKAQLQRNVKRWLDIVEAEYHVKPIIYTGYKFKMDYLNDPMFDEYPYWIAHYYVNELSYKGKWVMWQHTDCGKVDGIQGFVDVDIFNGSLQQLHDFCIQEEAVDAP